MSSQRFISLWGVFAVAIASSLGRAQSLPDFNKLRTPVSPAFTILGIAPAAVERPTLPATFTAGLVQGARDVGNGLPRSFAMEVAPYWMAPHPRLTLGEYERGGWNPVNLYRHFTFSLATTDSVGNGESAPEGNAEFRRLGFGARTLVFAGKTTPKAKKCHADVARAATVTAGFIGKWVAEAIARDPSLAGDSLRIEALNSQFFPMALDSLTPADRKILDETTLQCAEDLSTRTGLVMSLAGASALSFGNGKASSGKFSSAGVWLTPSWLGESFSNIAVVRARWDDLDTDTSSVSLDLGWRAVYAWSRFAMSAEAVGRSVRRESATTRLARLSLIFDTRLAGDTWVTMTFGKDFDPKRENSLLALLAFHWQIGDRTLQPDAPEKGGAGAPR